MNESFDVEIVLREVLEVLQKHNIPIETASLDVSLLDDAFDEHIPQLKAYKAGHFHRRITIDTVPLLFHAQRRYPFDEIVRVLEQEIRPPIETLSESLQREYPDIKITFVRESTTSSPDMWPFHSYQLGITCQFSDDIHAEDNVLDLSIFLKQQEPTAYPRLSALVGWLEDDESGGDWGLAVIDNYRETEYAPHHLHLLQVALPSLFQSYRDEIIGKLSRMSESES